MLNEEPHSGLILCSARLHRRDVGAMVRALVHPAERYPRGLGEYDVICL